MFCRSRRRMGRRRESFVQSQNLWVGSRTWASIGRFCSTKQQLFEPKRGPSVRLREAFHGFDVGVVFCPRIDVGVAILATGTQISRNLATPTSISWKAGHGNAKSGVPRHADVDPEESKPRQRKTQGTRHVVATHSGGPGMPKARPPPTSFGLGPKFFTCCLAREPPSPRVGAFESQRRSPPGTARGYPP